MELRHSIMVSILDRYADRFTEFQPTVSLTERIQQAASIPGAQAVELVFPGDLSDIEMVQGLLEEVSLPVSAVNLNIKSDKCWRNGSFTNPDLSIRKKAVSWLKRSMDISAELGSYLVTVCPLMDGWDYNFQVDYTKQWEWLYETFSEAMAHRSDVRVGIEYKARESRTHISLPDAGTTLHLCDRVDAPNLGVTMDVGHSLLADETPAMSASMAHAANRLFYVHFNDNNRGWDWDIVPGAVNIWDMLETLYYLENLNWDGWLAYDVFTKHGNPVKAFESTISAMRSLQLLLSRIGRDRVRDIIENADPAEGTAELLAALAEDR